MQAVLFLFLTLMLKRDKIYNVKEDTHEYEAPKDKAFYLPETLGLNPHEREDMILYVESEGDEVLARHMLAQRKLWRQHNQGTIDDEAYQQGIDELYTLIDERRREIGSPYGG